MLAFTSLFFQIYLDDFFRVKSLYTGDEIGNLDMQIGDIVKVVNQRNSGWLWVNHNEAEGWYPKTHLTPYDNPSYIGKIDDIQIISLKYKGPF